MNMKFVTIEGCACIVGRIHGIRSPWIVREPITGIAVANAADTRKGAIENAAQAIRAAGGSERFAQAIQANLP